MTYTEHIPSTDDILKLRSSRHSVRLAWNAAPKTVVATALINQTSFTYPLAQLTVDHTVNWTSVREGMAVWVGTTPESYDVTAGVVRKAPLSNTLYIDAKSLGDSGYSRNIFNGLADNLYVTILKHRPLWGFLSSIRSGLFYKKWDLVYTDEGSNPYGIVNLGKHKRVKADSSGYATVEWVANVSFFGGLKTVTSQIWYGDIGTVVAGDVQTNRIVSKYAPGWYVVEYAVIDSGGKLSSAYRYLWVNPQNDSGSGSSFGSTHKWVIDEDRQEDTGREVDITFYGSLITVDDIYPGQPFLLTEEAYYDGQRLSDIDVTVNNFIGYASEYRPFRGIQTSRVSLSLLNPLSQAKTIPAATQLIQEVVSPANWTEATSLLTNPIGAIYYILQHHCPNFWWSQDLQFSSNILLNREQAIKLSQDNISGQMTSFSETMPGTVGIRSDGTLVILRSPMHMSNSDRNSLNTKFTWGAGDIEGTAGLRYLRSLPLKAGQVKSLALAYEGGVEALPYASLAPGKTQAQGVGKPQYTFILPYSDPTTEQDRLNEITGHQFAIENAAILELDLTADRNLDICEPCDTNTWHYLLLNLNYDPLGVGFGIRWIPTRIRRQYKQASGGGWTKKIDITIRVETFGQRGVTVPVERGDWEDWIVDGFNLETATDFDPKSVDTEDEGDDFPPSDYWVNFNLSGWQFWTPTGDVGTSAEESGSGNPGLAHQAKHELAAGFIGQPFFAQTQITVDLQGTKTVTDISFDYSTDWFQYTPSTTTIQISTNIGSVISENPVNLQGGFRTRAVSGLSIAGATQVIVYVQQLGSASLVDTDWVKCIVDNIRINTL